MVGVDRAMAISARVAEQRLDEAINDLMTTLDRPTVPPVGRGLYPGLARTDHTLDLARAVEDAVAYLRREPGPKSS